MSTCFLTVNQSSAPRESTSCISNKILTLSSFSLSHYYLDFVQFDFTNRKGGVFAYVFADKPYQFSLCDEFWTAPSAATDGVDSSKAVRNPVPEPRKFHF